jgi:hypothetical protein
LGRRARPQAWSELTAFPQFIDRQSFATSISTFSQVSNRQATPKRDLSGHANGSRFRPDSGNARWHSVTHWFETKVAFASGYRWLVFHWFIWIVIRRHNL